VIHFAVKDAPDERLEPVPRHRGSPQDTKPTSSSAPAYRRRMYTSDAWPTSQAITPDLHTAARLACSAGATQPCDSTETSGGRPPPSYKRRSRIRVPRQIEMLLAILVFEPIPCSCRRGNPRRVFPETASANAWPVGPAQRIRAGNHLRMRSSADDDRTLRLPGRKGYNVRRFGAKT
jgi:hypothetical protein